VPTTATRSPASGWSWSHRAEWKILPVKRSSPGSTGVAGSDSPPAPEMSTRAVRRPQEVWMVQRPAPSSQAASSSAQPMTT